jgi:hypothetical protein
MASLNQRLDLDTISVLCDEFKCVMKSITVEQQIAPEEAAGAIVLAKSNMGEFAFSPLELAGRETDRTRFERPFNELARMYRQRFTDIRRTYFANDRNLLAAFRSGGGLEACCLPLQSSTIWIGRH